MKQFKILGLVICLALAGMVLSQEGYAGPAPAGFLKQCVLGKPCTPRGGGVGAQEAVACASLVQRDPVITIRSRRSPTWALPGATYWY